MGVVDKCKPVSVTFVLQRESLNLRLCPSLTAEPVDGNLQASGEGDKLEVCDQTVPFFNVGQSSLIQSDAEGVELFAQFDLCDRSPTEESGLSYSFPADVLFSVRRLLGRLHKMISLSGQPI